MTIFTMDVLVDLNKNHRDCLKLDMMFKSTDKCLFVYKSLTMKNHYENVRNS